MKRRTIFGWMTVVCVSLVTLVAVGGYIWGLSNLPGRDYREQTLALLQDDGLGAPVIRQVMSQAPIGANVCVVRKESRGDVYAFCRDPFYANTFVRNSGPGEGIPVYATTSSVLAPDGNRYYLMMWRQDTLDVFKWLATLASLGLLGAWMFLALWVQADARVRGSRAAAGWLLLTLMTGPVGLAVWLVARGEPVPKPLCPGCGADMVPGTMFCVRCGHPLHPACPECGSKVEADWAHCGTCGTSLGEEGGEADGVLAHENGA